MDANGNKAMATFTEQRLGTFAVAIGRFDDSTAQQKEWEKSLKKTYPSVVYAGRTDVEFTYAVDQWNQTPQSGNVAVSYRVTTEFTVTTKTETTLTVWRDNIS